MVLIAGLITGLTSGECIKYIVYAHRHTKTQARVKQAHRPELKQYTSNQL